MDEHYKFGGGEAATVLHPVVLVCLILAVILLFVLPKRYLLGPVVFMSFLVPMGQQLYIGGVHLFVLRIVVLLAFVRALSSRSGPDDPLLAGGWTRVDSAFAIYAVGSVVAVSLTYHGDTGVLVNQVGYLWDFLLGYVVVRTLLRNEDDLYVALKFLAVVTIPLVVGMVIEQHSMLNIFGKLGGVQLVPEVREGKIRSQGSFAHSLMAGTFAATMVPVFLMFWREGKSRVFGIVGVLGATIMTWTTNSSTPLMAYVGGVFALLCWPIRKSMKKVRWGIAFALVGLQLVMKAPVWFLIARVDLTGGSSSYHRAQLVDEFMNHIPEWFLIGVKDTSDWGLDMWDVQNQYVNIGEAGGIVAFVCFILVITRSFGMLGNARKVVDGDKDKEWMIWCLGSALFANVVGFFGVNYFDNSRMWWFILLAMISAICSPIVSNAAAVKVISPAEEMESRKPWVKVRRVKPVGQGDSAGRPGKLVPRLR